jgi:eukaryotic-like serine/threonine-protein kinase
VSRLPDSDRWRRLDAALREVLELGPEARALWIATHCSAKPELAAELRRMVEYADQDGPLERVGHSAMLADALAALSGGDARIGEWLLLRRIGTGGMAEIFLAERERGGVHQRAALKLMAGGLSSPELRARFTRERSVLARFSDARIARYFDGGIADNGRLWFAMEYVEGRPIDRHCVEHRLTLRERLALFRDVCGAVAHAHRHLVIHRDIKPSNVLVSNDGQVKLLDFGIAKALEADDGMTRTSARVLTPHYASPEQLRGEPASTVTDVFQLGLLLYEMIADCRPFAEHESDSFLLERALREDDPPLPSSVLALERRARSGQPAISAREVRGDLDRIVLLALRKDPVARYSSVERFDDDIARFLAGQPVAARGDAISYRLRKWLARHRIAAAALTGALLVAIVYSFLLIHQNHLIADQRDHARSAAAQAAAVKDFLLDLFNEADPARTLGEKLSVGAVLEKGSARIANGFDSQPRIRAEMQLTIGSAYHALGNFSRARELLEQTVALRRQWPDANADLARSLTALAAVERDDSHLDRSIELSREAVDQSGTDLHARALALNELGVGLLMRDQDLHAARLALDEALAVYRQWSEPDAVRIAIAQGNHAAIDLGEGKLDAATAGFKAAVDVLAPRLGDMHPEVTALLYNLARVEERAGKLNEAELHFNRVIAAETRVLGADHPDVAIDRTRLAYVQSEQGHYEIAEATFFEALAALRAKLPADHKRIAENLMGYAEVLIGRGRNAEAASGIDEAIAILRKHFEDDDWRIAEARRIQARVWQRQGRMVQALALLRQSETILLAQPSPYPERYRAALAEIGGATAPTRR